MSFVHVAWAFKQDVGNPTRKLVLVALAERCHKETLVCRPYITTIASDCNLSESGVRKAIKELCDMKVITSSRRRVTDGSYRGYDYEFPTLTIVQEPPSPHSAPPSPGSGDPASPGDGHEPAVDLEPKLLLAAAPRKRNGNWDALTSLFGDATTRTSQKLRGKVCASLDQAGATPDEIIGRAKRWRHVFPNAALTETALEKHWPLLQPPRARAPASVRSEPQPSPLTAVEREANVRAAKAGLQELRRNL